jgi:hypothetical protein
MRSSLRLKVITLNPFFEKLIIFRELFYFWYEFGIQKPFLLFSYSLFNLRGIHPTMRYNNSEFPQSTLCRKLADSPNLQEKITPTDSIVENSFSWVTYEN